MLHVIFSALRTVLAAFACGISIKIMDDCIDMEQDLALGFPNVSHKYGSGVIAYGMLSLLIACCARLSIAAGLFMSAYIVGMGFEGNVSYPTRLSARWESLIVLVLSIALVGMRTTAMSMCIMVAVQLIDNWWDENRGLAYPVAAIGLIAVALVIDLRQALLVLFAYALFFALERWWHSCIQ